MKKSFEIFVCRLPEIAADSRKISGEALVKRAALAYGAPKEAVEQAKILRTPQGKPYFENLDIHFNISHSGNTWACLIGPTPCGLDVQYVKPCNFEKIAGRFFSQDEQKYVTQYGIEGFFHLWTRREAYGKFTGEGFFCSCPELVLPSGELARKVGATTLQEIQMEDGLKCVVCLEADQERTVIRREL